MDEQSFSMTMALGTQVMMDNEKFQEL